MKSLSTMNVQAIYKNSQQSSEQDKQQQIGKRESAIIERFWNVMSELYSHQWTSGVGEVPTERWVKALSHYPLEKITKFISMCEMGKHYTQWPPTVRDFHIFCKPTTAAHREYKGEMLIGHERKMKSGSKVKEMLAANEACKKLIRSFGLVARQSIEITG